MLVAQQSAKSWAPAMVEKHRSSVMRVDKSEDAEEEEKEEEEESANTDDDVDNRVTTSRNRNSGSRIIYIAFCLTSKSIQFFDDCSLEYLKSIVECDKDMLM
jgi:hypothetical protein